MGKFKTGVALEQENVAFLSYLQREQKINTLTDIVNFVIREYKKMRMDLVGVDFKNQKTTALKIKSCFQSERRNEEVSPKKKKKKIGHPKTRPLTAKELLEREFALTVIKEKQKLEKAQKKAQEREKQQQEQYKKGFDDILDSFMSGDNGDNIFGL